MRQRDGKEKIQNVSFASYVKFWASKTTASWRFTIDGGSKEMERFATLERAAVLLAVKGKAMV